MYRVQIFVVVNKQLLKTNFLGFSYYYKDDDFIDLFGNSKYKLKNVLLGMGGFYSDYYSLYEGKKVKNYILKYLKDKADFKILNSKFSNYKIDKLVSVKVIKN